jgi:hypothetical protein
MTIKGGQTVMTNNGPVDLYKPQFPSGKSPDEIRTEIIQAKIQREEARDEVLKQILANLIELNKRKIEEELR